MKKIKSNTQSVSGHRIGLYVRVSSEEQASNPEGSIKSQEQRLRQQVAIKNHDGTFGEVAEVFIDARSGKDTNRSELQRLLTAIRRGEITLVMVTELSRLSRSIKDFCGIWELMQEHQCDFMSLREQFDSSTAAGEMVLYMIANIAQFERRQISERVIANLQARSARGLYNGGIIPVGYQTIADKKGYLEIDPEQSPTIKKAFQIFLEEGWMAATAKRLNEEGYRLARHMKGGGYRPRLGHFTVSNLHIILRNKAYVGIKTHLVHGKLQEAKAVWEPIIDPVTFERCQKMLATNHKVRKPESETRYPFILSGFIYCASCGDRLSGKSANGNGGKIAYYEHAWSTKKQGCLKEKVFNCKPNRVLAKKIEPAVWEQLEALLFKPEMAAALIAEARTQSQPSQGGNEETHLKEKIQAIESQIDALTERLSELPKNIPATRIFKQMEKLEASKALEETKLQAVKKDNPKTDIPTGIENFKTLLGMLKSFTDDPAIQTYRAKLIEKLIHKVEITSTSFKLYFHVGSSHIERELATTAGSRLFLRQNGGKKAQERPRGLPQAPRTGEPDFFKLFGSNSLQIGWETREGSHLL